MQEVNGRGRDRSKLKASKTVPGKKRASKGRARVAGKSAVMRDFYGVSTDARVFKPVRKELGSSRDRYNIEYDIALCLSRYTSVNGKCIASSRFGAINILQYFVYACQSSLYWI